MLGMNINKNKNIGKVIYIVEGEKKEFTLLKHFFMNVFNYNLVVAKRQKEDEMELYISNENSNSQIFILNSETSNINSIINGKDYLDNIYRKLNEDYDLIPDNASIYYIFDRDKGSNSANIITDLLTRLKNSKDNGIESNGLLLLNYPSIESLVISCFKKNSMNLCVMPKGIKSYLEDNKLYQDRIFEKEILCGCNELINTVFQLIKHKICLDDLDDFYQINLNIFNLQENLFEKNQPYVLLSLFLISFLDLGLISIE